MVKGKQTIAVDLDGVLAQYDHWVSVEHIGPPIHGAKAFMTALSHKYYVMVYTCRASADYNPGMSPGYLKELIENWLYKHKIPFNEVYQGRGKPLASCYVDDRAIVCRPEDTDQPTAHTFFQCLEQIDERCGVIEESGDGDYAAELEKLRRSQGE